VSEINEPLLRLVPLLPHSGKRVTADHTGRPMLNPERITLYWPRGLYFWRAKAKYAEGPLLEEKRHGKWVFWYLDGQKQLEGEYIKGNKTGAWIKWAEDGKKISEGEFFQGKMHGRWIDWHGNGQKALESKWVMGKKDGKWMYWSADGSVQKTENHDHRYEEDKGYSLYTDLEAKEMIRQIQRKTMDGHWERLVGKFVAGLVKPWHIACWILIFVPTLSLTKDKAPQHDIALAGILAMLITSLLAWGLDRRGPK